MSISALYAVIVVQCGIAPDYFLDRMQWYEVDACLEGLRLSERAGWEQTRYICYVTAQVQSRRKLKLSDVIEFEWDRGDSRDRGETAISSEEVARLKEKAARIAAKL
ncbi:MAG: hypothetical protein LBP50_01775 [Tannerella sp.]|jgi:hypothetical protein|nr:hypothetical protein [Tannerella sp.]